MRDWTDTRLGAHLYRFRARLAWWIDCEAWKPETLVDRIRHRIACWVDSQG